MTMRASAYPLDRSSLCSQPSLSCSGVAARSELCDKSIDLEAVGSRIQSHCESLHVTQRQFAERACLSGTYTSRVENGSFKCPKLHDLAVVARALRMTIEELRQAPAKPLSDNDEAKLHGLLSDPDSGVEFAMAARFMRDLTDAE
ncbi:MAG: helix-turn-helix domain-containing protein [Chloroflexota bacterium]